MGAPSLQPFQLDQTFFGFNAKHQVEFHDSIFNLIWFGEGRWDWDTIYNMPIHIRRRWITHVNKMIDDKPKTGSTSNNSTTPRGPSKKKMR